MRQKFSNSMMEYSLEMSIPKLEIIRYVMSLNLALPTSEKRTKFPKHTCLLAFAVLSSCCSFKISTLIALLSFAVTSKIFFCFASILNYYSSIEIPT